MDKRTRRNIIRVLAGIFWIALAIMAKSQSFKPEKDPYIYAVLVISFVGYLIYENFYRLPKIEKVKETTRNNQLEQLLERKLEYEPKINPMIVPETFRDFIPLAKKWGIDNRILREHLYESANDSELLELKKIEIESKSIKQWIESTERTSETTAFSLTLQAYSELGLWTWEETA
ncbi:MAG: hypothetical protein RLO12_01455 [Fulvivirga sp.]